MKTVWAGLLAATAVVSAGTARAQNASPLDAIASGHLIMEERLRYEDVDQANFIRSAEALTLRTHLGWETGAWNQVKGLVEFEAVSHLGPEHFNDTVNKATLYPGVNDPVTSELNRLQLTWAPSPLFTATVGRQRLTLDDQRFIGDANWRQDETTFDAARVDSTYGKFSGTYVYIVKDNRNLAQTADYDSKSHGLIANYAFSPLFKLQGFLFALDLKQSPNGSTLTEGLKVTGQTAVSGVKLAYAARYAQQRDYAANPGHYEVPYWMGEVSAGWSGWGVKANYESLGSDGKHSFTTPFASLHTYQGWGDVFSTPPARGVDDANISATYNPPIKWRYASDIQLFARHHDFHYASGPGGLGTQWNLGVQAGVVKGLTALIDYADYHGVTAVPGRRKLWLQLDFALG